IWQYTEKPRDYNRARFGSRAEMAAWARGDLEPVKPAPVYKRPKLKERVSWRGGRTCTCVIESVEKVVEPRLKAAGVIKYSVDFYQLGYRTDVSASAGTHAGGGVVDVAQYSDKAIRIWREAGWAMWHRTPAQGFMHHGPGVLEGCPHLPSAARSQLTQYHNGTNGLRGHGKDDGPRIKLPDWDDAIRDYLRETAPKPPPAAGGSAPVPEPLEPVEELLMAVTPRRIYTTKPQAIREPSKWQYLYLTDKGNTSFTAGLDGEKAQWWGHLNVRLEGLPAGQSAYFRVVEDEVVGGKTTRRVTYRDHHEVLGSGGTTQVSIPLDGVTGKNPKKGTVYVRVQWHASVPTARIVLAEVFRRSTGK